MDLLHAWNQYEETGFNISALPESMLKQGVKIECAGTGRCGAG